MARHTRLLQVIAQPVIAYPDQGNDEYATDPDIVKHELQTADIRE